ncbi:MAG: DUF2764 family protein [Chlamydiota bacterium]
MSGYFFLGSSLPSISVGSEPGISFDDLMVLYKENLGSSDLGKVKVIRGYVDLKNIRNLIRKEKIDHRGNLDEQRLDEAMINREGLPSYVFDFLEEYREASEQLRNYSKIFISFFREADNEYRGFLREYFRFERGWRVLLAGYRAKRLGVDPAIALRHEDLHDPLVAQVLAQKDAPSFEFPVEDVELGEKLKGAEREPDKHYRLMADFRFRRIEDIVQDYPFSIDYLLGYSVRLMIVEDLFALDEKRGNENLNEMVKGNLI